MSDWPPEGGDDIDPNSGPGAPSTALVLAHTGEVVDLGDERQVAKALSEVQVLKAKLAEADRRLREAIAERSRVLGTKTLHIAGVGRFEVKGGTVKRYDAEALEEGFRKAGMPEDRIEEMFVTTVSRRPIAVELNKAAKANPEYARVIEEATQTIEQTPTVSIT